MFFRNSLLSWAGHKMLPGLGDLLKDEFWPKLAIQAKPRQGKARHPIDILPKLDVDVEIFHQVA